ncbi:beta-propeller domain-containing protein [Candidatus Methylobacter oryzae]|uniref:Uncharacterized protein n=1 Tax=Candidatus Methylobacter oryzae TaxID=2497749 RepID=A0ABY3CA38_9GAMM|nr:beta-propeller domain-containing protein [Candidatus Methylobacter oryzae]TRW94617.1 hypothetical protein EKO24_011175 [Candidatus Methylobacter oryzae]
MTLNYGKETDSWPIHLCKIAPFASGEVIDGRVKDDSRLPLRPSVLSKYCVVLLAMLLGNHMAYAWNVTVQTDAPNAAAVSLENDTSLSKVDVYLTWLDLDDKTETGYRSWIPALGWQNGLVPEWNGKDLAPFSSQPVTSLPSECPAQHRCFLAWVATPNGADPLDWKRWRASSLLPLNALAATARLPGQHFFLANNSVSSTFSVTAGIATDAAGTATTSTIEKPDVFHLEGTRLFYANAQAQRLQIIETANATAPQLVSSTVLSGFPKEIYTLGQYHLVLLNSATSSAGAQISVFRENGDGSQSEISTFKLSGQFLESRRRGDVIYTVSTHYDPELRLVVQSLVIDANGQLSERANQAWNAYDPHVALFADYLVITGGIPGNWTNTELRVFDLRDPAQPLRALPQINLSGRVPSEFHLDVSGNQLRVVYSAADANSGSVLSVYDLNAELAQLGSVGGIAPKEALFATRFAENFAYVVTYERKDPLWVIGLSDPTKPVILGELQVPGWSEKLFVHGDRVFGLGVDDQPFGSGTWARRVAASLFDVSVPAAPGLLGRFTAVTDDSVYSWSQALSDERALLLDWEKQYALLPVESWGNTPGSYLQWVDFSSGVPKDGGQLKLSTQAERSVALSSELWGVLGNQSFLTVGRSNGVPQVLGQVELARNVSWLYLDEGELWSGVYGNQGYYRLYRQKTANPDEAEMKWNLDHNYNQILATNSHVFFFRWQPFTLGALDRVRGELLPTLAPTNDKNSVYGQAFADGDRFYISNSTWQDVKALDSQLALPDKTGNTGYLSWTLQGWQAAAAGMKFVANYNIPGQPIGFASAGGLLVSENGTDTEPLRIDLLTLDANGNASLRDSLTLPCPAYSNTLLQGDTLYISCGNAVIYSGAKVDSANTGNKLHAFRVDGATLTPSGEWAFDEWPRPLAASNNGLVLVGAGFYPIYYTDVVGIAAMSIGTFPSWSSSCRLYDMTSLVPVLLDTFDNCPAAQDVAMDDKNVYFAHGFAGIETHQIKRK